MTTKLTKANVNKKNNKKKKLKKFTKKPRKVLENKFKPQTLLVKPTTKWETAVISILTTQIFKKLNVKASKMFETTERRKYIQV